MPMWPKTLTERDREVFAAAGYGSREHLGSRPALLVIDVTYAFCGDHPEPILQSVRRWRNSCGDAAWEAIAVIAELLETARRNGVPIVYTRGAPPEEGGTSRGRWSDKNSRAAEDSADANRIVGVVEPSTEDTVILKAKPSGFFGTPLASRLVELGVDTLLVCGGTTSGCVRATVVDGFSFNYHVGVVAEATFDRGETSHEMSLFDMDMKYADVMSASDAKAYLTELDTAGHEPGLRT